MDKQGVYHGQEQQEAETVDWEEIFKVHVAETRRLEREAAARIERSQKSEKSWELLRLCKEYLKENEQTWKQEGENNIKNAKRRKLKLAEKQKQATLTRICQAKITETWGRLPKDQQKILQAEEATRRRFELREAKSNVWKKWRKKKDKNQPEEQGSQDESRRRSQEQAWLEKLEDTLKRLKREKIEKRATRETHKNTRRKLLAEKKFRQEEILRQEQEKLDRKIKKKMLEERWTMMNG